MDSNLQSLFSTHILFFEQEEVAFQNINLAT